MVVMENNVLLATFENQLSAFEAMLGCDAKEVKVRNNNICGIEVEAIKEGNGVIESLEDRITGRVLAEDIIDPATGEKIASLNDAIDEALAKKIAAVRDRVSIHSGARNRGH